MVIFIDPDRLALDHGFFRDTLPEEVPIDGFRPVKAWLAEQILPDSFQGLGGIVHVSRCGSTLTCQNLKQTGQAVVLGEAPFLSNERQSMAEHLTEAEQEHAMIAITAHWLAWARARGQHLVLKFGSRVLSPEVMARLPGARFMFLGRDPLPVMESLSRKPATFINTMAEAHEAAGHPTPKVAAAAEHLRTCFAKARKLPVHQMLTVDYSELAGRYKEILRHFEIDADTAPPWSESEYAKWRSPEDRRPYVPLATHVLPEFARTHAALVGPARREWEDLRVALGVGKT